MRQNIEVRSDGGDFLELWVNGVRVMEACSDDVELEGIYQTASAIANALGIEYTDNYDYEWIEELGLVTPEEAEAYYNEDEDEEEQKEIEDEEHGHEK